MQVCSNDAETWTLCTIDDASYTGLACVHERRPPLACAQVVQ